MEQSSFFIASPRMSRRNPKEDFLSLVEHLMDSDLVTPPFCLFGGPFSAISPTLCSEQLSSLRPPAPGFPELLAFCSSANETRALIEQYLGKRDLCLYTDSLNESNIDLADKFEEGEWLHGHLACYALLERASLVVEETSCEIATELFVERYGREELAEEYGLGLIRPKYSVVFEGVDHVCGTPLEDIIRKFFGRDNISGIYSSRVLCLLADKLS